MRRFLAVLALVAVVACAGDSTTNPASDSIAGTYALQTVNGNPLPYTIQSGSVSEKITSDVLTVAEGGTWSETYTLQETISGSTTTQTGNDGGTWSRTGTAIAFSSTTTSSTAYTGTFSGSSLHLTDGTFTQVFTR